MVGNKQIQGTGSFFTYVAGYGTNYLQRNQKISYVIVQNYLIENEIRMKGDLYAYFEQFLI